jgi:uncharacterized membrane protein
LPWFTTLAMVIVSLVFCFSAICKSGVGREKRSASVGISPPFWGRTDLCL